MGEEIGKIICKTKDTIVRKVGDKIFCGNQEVTPLEALDFINKAIKSGTYTFLLLDEYVRL